MMCKHATYNNAFSGQFVGSRRHLLFAQRHLQPVSAQALYYLHRYRVSEIGHNALGYNLAYTLHLQKVLQACRGKSIYSLEMAGKQACCCLANKSYSERKDHTFKRHLLRCLNAVYNLFGRLLTVAVAVYLLHFNVIQVSNITNKSVSVEIVNSLRSNTVYVHCLTRNEMLYASLYLRRTSRIVRTIICGFALIPYQLGSTLRTVGYKPHWLGYNRALLNINSDNLRNNLASLFNIHIIAYMQVQAAYKVFVVERSTPYGCSGQLNRLHIGYRSNSSSTPHLKCHFIKTCAGSFCLKLISYGPTRILCSIAKSPLLSE